MVSVVFESSSGAVGRSMKPRFWCLFFLLYLNSGKSVFALRCSNYDYSDRCQIQNLNLFDTNITALKFPVQENYELYNAELDYLSPALMARMQWISTLTIEGGKVITVYLKPDLLKLIVRKSETSSIEIDSDPNENLAELEVTNCHLQAIPDNIGKLVALTKLILNDNKIEAVDLSVLNGLAKVTAINLANNKIYSLTVGDNVELLQLQTLDLTKNYLTELDLTEWIMPRLQQLSISDNYLKYLTGFYNSKFSLLEVLNLHFNVWNCRWLDAFLPTVKTINNNDYYNKIKCTKFTELSPETFRRLNITDVRGSNISFTNRHQLEEQFDSITHDNLKQAKLIKSQSEKLQLHGDSISEANKLLQDQQAIIEKLLQRVESLELSLKQAKQGDIPFGDDPSPASGVPKGISAKLIEEISEVIRKNLPN